MTRVRNGFLLCQAFCNVQSLSASLLTCLHEFVQVRRWPNLENVAVRQGWMLRHELHSVVHVSRLKDENAAELFLGLGVGAVRRCHFAVLPTQGDGGLLRLQRFSTIPVSVGAKTVVVGKAGVEHRVSLIFSHAIEFAFIEVSETDVFHWVSFPGASQQHSPALDRSSYRRCVYAKSTVEKKLFLMATGFRPPAHNTYARQWTGSPQRDYRCIHAARLLCCEARPCSTIPLRSRKM